MALGMVSDQIIPVQQKSSCSGVIA